MVINASTGKIYVDTVSGQDDIIEIAHTAANTWTEAVKAGAGDLVSGPRMGVYNPFNTSVYFVNGFRLTRITSGGTLTRMASARLYIVCNSITGDILSHGQTTIVDFTKAADATPAVDSTVTLPFTIAGQMAFWNPDGTNPNARFFIPKVSTAIVYMYDTDLLVLRRTITFTGKTVTGCIIPEETGDYLFVTFSDTTTGVYNMATNTWICTLYSTAAPSFIVHHPTTGYRTVKGGTVFAPVLIAESSDDIQTGTPIGEVIQSADDNCLTAVQQQTLLDNITHYTTC